MQCFVNAIWAIGSVGHIKGLCIVPAQKCYCRHLVLGEHGREQRMTLSLSHMPSTFLMQFLPFDTNDGTVSQPVKAWNICSAIDSLGPNDAAIS